LLCLLLSVQTSAQIGAYSFETVETEADANTVYSIATDSCGLMWIGTNQGLNFYDGYKLHHCYDQGKKSNTHIYSILARGNRFYLGSDNGLLIYDLATDRYIDTGKESPRNVRALAVEGENLLVGSLNGLYRYNISKQTFTRIERGLPHNAVYAITEDKARPGNYFIGTYNGLCLLHKGADQLRSIPIAEHTSHSRNVFVNSLLYDNQRNMLWVGTEGALYFLTPSGTTYSVNAVSALSGNSVKSLAEDSVGNIIIGTDNGLYIYDGTRTVCYTHDSRIDSSLSNNVVWCVYADRNNTIWAGTEYNVSITKNSKNYDVYPLSLLTGRGDGNQIYEIYRDSNNNLWFGGTNGLIKYNYATKTPTWFKPGDAAHPLPHNRIRNIMEDSDGDVWIATDGSINRYDSAGDRFVCYSLTDRTGNFNANWAYSIVEDDAHNLWTGSYLGGILVANLANLKGSNGAYKAEKAYNSTSGMPNNFVNEMIVDSSGNHWIALFQSSEIVKVNKATGATQRINLRPGIDGTPEHIIAAEGGGIWCLAQDCLVRIADSGAITATYKIPAREHVSTFAIEKVNNELWIASTTGLWSFNTESKTFRLVPVPIKLYTAIYYSPITGMVYIGGVDEITRVSPSITDAPTQDIHLVITEIYINEERYVPQDGSVRALQKLEFGYNDNHLTIYFSDLNYSRDNRQQYEYRLVGAYNEWISLNKDINAITISNIAPGKYRLEIRRAGSSDTATVFSIPLKINAPWYDSVWAHLFYALVVIGLIAWAINTIRIRQHLKFERMERSRTIESVKNRIDFLTNISHELKTPLSMIIGPVSKMLNDSNDSAERRKLNGIYKNAMKLNALIHRALEMNRMDNNDDEAMLIYSQVDIIGFTRGIFDNYKEAFPKINFIFSCDVQSRTTEIDAVKFESVLNNVISNACKYSSTNATIALSLTEVDDQLLFKLSDDGVGIPADERPLIFQRLFQSTRTSGNKEGTGIGLYLAKKYVEMHHGTISVDANEGGGTVFSITLPIRNSENNDETEVNADTAELTNRRTVLIVDDNIAISQFIKEVLSDKYRCIIAANGRAGLAVCGSLTPDIIIADIMMPVMDGMEMCRRIKANPQLASIPIILLTAKDDTTTEAESINIGADIFMSKPFEPQMLLARVQQLLKATDTIRRDIRIEMLTAAKDVEAESADEHTLADIAKLIEDNISDTDLNVTYVCEKLGLSSKQLYRLIKKYIGITPVDYIRQIRMKKAAMLLSQGTFTVAEVMYMVGFSSASYFSKCFTAQFGETPRHYLEKVRSN
jgi:signal transduction histidine kinase/ligand-binding sensor domain-containing protein/AraC-like DNA-binding protein